VRHIAGRQTGVAAVSPRCEAPKSPRGSAAHLRGLAQRKKVLTLVIATKDIDISEIAVLAKLVLLS
jgi:hypothetical protein